MEPWREREKREHPTNPRQCRDPRFVGVRSGIPPYACDPTAGGRDGIDMNNICEIPPTALQDGKASCGARRQPAPSRQGNRSCECGKARSPGDGVEETRLGLCSHSRLEETPLQAWPAGMDPTQSADGMASVAGRLSPCPEGNCGGTRGTARDTCSEAEFPELGSERDPLRHKDLPPKAWPAGEDSTRRSGGLTSAAGKPFPCPEGDHDGTRGAARETRGDCRPRWLMQTMLPKNTRMLRARRRRLGQARLSARTRAQRPRSLCSTTTDSGLASTRM